MEKIKTGDVKVAFRKWENPTIKVNGTLKTAIGVLKFRRVQAVTSRELTEADARMAGFSSVMALLKELNTRKKGKLYKIEFDLIGPDPRIKLRNQKDFTVAEQSQLVRKLARLDKASRAGSWTQQTLNLIQRNPAVGSKILATKLGMDQAAFKLNVRKLKNLGLTISLETGYKLSPRGKALLRKLKG